MHPKYFIVLAALIVTNVAIAQKTIKKTITTTAATPVLKNLSDSASYAIGISVAKFYQQQGVKNLNTALITKAINDAFANKKIMIDDMQANDVIMKFLGKLDMAKSKPNIEKGEKFLAENKSKPGTITTASGLQYQVLTKGTGLVPKSTDTVLCHYKGVLLDGTEFDNSYSRGEPISFVVTGVIKGWTEALLMMPVGSKWKLFVPSSLAYGSSDYGPIPGGSVLTFEVELLDILNKPH